MLQQQESPTGADQLLDLLQQRESPRGTGPLLDLLQQRESPRGTGPLLTLPDSDDADDQSDLPGPQLLPWWRRRSAIVAIAALSLFFLVGSLTLVVFQSQMPVITYRYQRVTQSNFSLTISATGPLQSSTYDINFAGTGKIAEIDVKVGQTVKQGQVVAKLDITSLQDAVNQAQAEVTAAQTAVNSGQAGSDATQGLSQAIIAAARTALKNAQTNLVKTKAQSKAEVAAAQTALDDANANQQAIQSQGQTNVTSAQTAVTDAQQNLQAVQAQAQANENTALVQKNQACSATPTPQVTCASATAQYNQAVASGNASINQAQAGLNTANTQLTTAQSQADTNNTAAQKQVKNAQKGLDTAKKTAALSNAAAQNQVNSAQKGLNTAIANANLSNTVSQGTVNNTQSQLNVALAKLQTAENNLHHATLTAPRAGIVAVINGTVGGAPGIPINATVTPASGPQGNIFMQIVDVSSLQVQADVDESDAANVQVGDSVSFTVPAYGTRIFHGTVSAVSPNGETTSNVVSYPVTVDVDPNSLQGATLLPGMTASVTILLVQRPNQLLIPVKAVNFAQAAAVPSLSISRLITQQQALIAQDQADQMLQQLHIQQPNVGIDNPFATFVLEQSNGHFIAKPVVLGVSDGMNYEVLAGLSLNENVVADGQPQTRK